MEQDFEMNTLQSDQAVQIVGIWGMGGSGKTTLAKHLYNKKSSSMQRSSFIFDVRDGATKGVLQKKQIQLLNDLGVKKDIKFDNIEQGKAFLTRHLTSVRVLIALDDVDDVDQLDALLPVKDTLGSGSLIIVTTREKEVLRSKGISRVYEMKALDQLYGRQLFSWHAFSKSIPLVGFEKLVERFVEVCRGLPLSLKIFGAQLYGEFRKEYWESLLDKISRILPDGIKEKLKLSYDVLDYEEKEMFLDTACFFIGEENSLAIEIWNGSGWSGLHGWEKLLNKCLVELDQYNYIKMHDHLRDLGREIANQHSPYRLWLPQQIINTENQTETRNDIRGIMAVSSEIKTWFCHERGKSFPIMSRSSRVSSDGELMGNPIGRNLSLVPSILGPRIFVIRRDYFNRTMGEVSQGLVWLRWFQIGQRNLSSRFSFKRLRVLELYEDGEEHHLKDLWEADNAPLQLRELVISGCLKFQRFPNSIGRLNVLKKIVIINGFNIRSLPEEFCRLQSLEHLQLKYCKKLSSLPTSFGNLRNLRFLDLSWCTQLSMLPDSFKNLMLLQYLDLSLCEQLKLRPEDFQNITKLEHLDLFGCVRVEQLPSHIINQASLRELLLKGTDRLRELPINIGQLRRLQKMTIGNKLLTSLPTSLGDLSSLTNLSIFYSPNLEYFPPLQNLSSLKSLSICSCPKLKYLPNSLGGSSLTNLVIRDCPKLKSLRPNSLGALSSLTELKIIHCNSLKCLPSSVERLNLLEHLTIQVCPVKCLPFALRNLKQITLHNTEVCRISVSEDRYPRLQSLSLSSMDHLMEIEALPTTIKSIELKYCKILKKIRATCDLVNLERLKIVSCPELDELPSFEHSTSLREFELRGGCYRIQEIEGLEYCTRLESLRIETCWDVPVIESLEQMDKLRRVEIRANKGSAIERCIQTIKKWPGEIKVCSRAVPDASSLMPFLLLPNLVVFDSFSNHKIQSRSKFVRVQSSNGDAIMICCVINCVSSQMQLQLSPHCRGGRKFFEYLPNVEKGRWILLAGFTLQSGYYDWQSAEEIEIEANREEAEIEDRVKEDKIEKCLVVRVEEQRLEEAFHSLLPLLQS
ncbi:disease resistance protein RUN1-like [Cryptomeria japonica]|uniref:disease resistance protein RUN1-like n=1 Tax=Cryptomeria japonica TaxID=3369 RepID=UPI0027DA9FEE|nr:disease resistance protein RUN1-like [Cryptomeria japonica]